MSCSDGGCLRGVGEVTTGGVQTPWNINIVSLGREGQYQSFCFIFYVSESQTFDVLWGCCVIFYLANKLQHKIKLIQSFDLIRVDWPMASLLRELDSVSVDCGWRRTREGTESRSSVQWRRETSDCLLSLSPLLSRWLPAESDFRLNILVSLLGTLSSVGMAHYEENI